MKKIMSDPVMTKRAADIGLIPIEYAVGSPASTTTSSRSACKWGALVDKIGLRGSQ